MKRTHELTHLITLSADASHCIEAILPAPNNSAVAFYCSGPHDAGATSDHDTQPHDNWFIWQGKEIARVPPLSGTEHALSHDGKKFAVGIPGADGRILINGVHAYAAPFDTIYHLCWLDNNTLVWVAWNKDVDANGRSRDYAKFRNGVVVTDKLDWEPDFYGGVQVLDLVKREAYYINPLGSIAHQGRIPEHVQRISAWTGRFSFNRRDDQPEPLHDKDGVALSFGGHRGPSFDAIESGGGIREWMLSEDASRVGYIGVRYGRVIGKLARISSHVMERCNDQKNIFARLLEWPLALMWSPYLPTGDLWLERSKRFYPTTLDHTWQKGYRFAGLQCFTGKNELVVMVVDDARRSRVVIDEDEGPPFAGIKNVCYLPDERAVSYMASRDGNDFFRVLVKDPVS